MKGLLIWANSYCRSTLAFYKGLGVAFDCPLKVIVLKELPEARLKTGFCASEFDDMDISVYSGLNAASVILDKYNGYYNIFGSYQSSESISLINLSIKKGIRFGICSEAPCNMFPFPKRILKELYMRIVLPYKVRSIVKHADFIVNFSGGNTNSLTTIGWEKDKVIPCGYYSPAIEGSKSVHRSWENWNNFTILLSGIHQWHRSPMVLLKALRELDKRGLKYKCNITQKGPLFEEMQAYINKYSMQNVSLLGFLSIGELISNYENCSVYIGAGNNEPWGMRLNDVLLCGAPMIVNRGMGGSMLVEEYKCGLTFAKNDYIGLADALERLIIDYEFYQKCADAAFKASSIITPENMSRKISEIIKQKI